MGTSAVARLGFGATRNRDRTSAWQQPVLAGLGALCGSVANSSLLFCPLPKSYYNPLTFNTKQGT